MDKIEAANIEINTEAARVMMENTKLDSDESNVSLVLKSLYTIVPLKDAIYIALKNIYTARMSHLNCQEVHGLFVHGC